MLDTLPEVRMPLFLSIIIGITPHKKGEASKGVRKQGVHRLVSSIFILIHWPLTSPTYCIYCLWIEIDAVIQQIQFTWKHLQEEMEIEMKEPDLEFIYVWQKVLTEYRENSKIDQIKMRLACGVWTPDLENLENIKYYSF